MADDPELEAIRQRRMAQMMAQQGGGGGGDAPATPEEMQAQDDAKQAQEEQRRAMLMNIMQPSARERLARISLVKPDKARAIEDMILMAARRGQIQEKVSEPRLIELLEKVSEQSEKKSKVTIQRRRGVLDDDW
ncbi:hypothetical protein D9Q98_001838 [Chlorella vulgaris]|uniref:Uncharacterized protein n=1 Tax=Chlorella vulgaris TaxID=3077 RepID=A0A9D4Z035_CHLVU|nr:hypothetical protein D9Q98_001838 [Chlorella vulgaris]